MSADVARSHGGDGRGEHHPSPHHVPSGCMSCFANRGKGKRKPNLGGRLAGRLNTRDKTRNLSLNEITDTKGPVPIQFKLRDKQTVMPLGDHAAHWSSYIGEVIRDPMTGTYNVEKIRRERPENITPSEWDKYIEFWNDPRNIARAAQNRQNRANSTVISRQGSRSLAHLRDEMMQTSTTQEYPSLIDTFFVAHTVNGEFLQDEDRRIYEEMRRLEATGTYTNDEIKRLARGEYCRHGPQPAQFESGGASESGGYEDEEEGADHQDDEDEDGDGDGDA
nr:hypothetical protein [Tanacetum cinerariifolium]